MDLGIINLVANIGMSFENVVLLIVLLGGLVFYAIDVRIGLMIQFIMTSGIFMWFFSVNYNWMPSLMVNLITLVLLALSLYSVANTGTRGVVI